MKYLKKRGLPLVTECRTTRTESGLLRSDKQKHLQIFLPFKTHTRLAADKKIAQSSVCGVDYLLIAVSCGSTPNLRFVYMLVTVTFDLGFKLGILWCVRRKNKIDWYRMVQVCL